MENVKCTFTNWGLSKFKKTNEKKRKPKAAYITISALEKPRKIRSAKKCVEKLLPSANPYIMVFGRRPKPG